MEEYNFKDGIGIECVFGQKVVFGNPDGKLPRKLKKWWKKEMSFYITTLKEGIKYEHISCK
jgi:hypothetical protein